MPGETVQDMAFLESLEPETIDILKNLGKMIHTLVDMRKEIEFMEEKLKEAKADEKILSGENIPTLLLGRGLSEIRLDTGEKIKIVEKLAVSMPKKDKNKRTTVFNWLVENGGSYLVKQILAIEEPEKHIIDYLREKAIPFINEKSVNTNSLKAFLADKLGMKKGSLQTIELSDVPKEANPFIYRETKII